jgi:short-subunit dehydrogenase
MRKLPLTMSWALVAGGSKGIGLGITEALAKRNFNVLLVARDLAELTKIKTRLEAQFPVQVEILSCDLALPESSKIIFEWCANKNLEIKILCNAAGLGGSVDFPTLPLSELRTMIHLNFESAVALSYMFIPLLKKTAPSFILNVGSMAGFAPIPIKNVYSSTKAALHSFSYSLKYLLKANNISVSCVSPGPVFTKLSIEKETISQLGWIGRWMAVSPSRVGEYAVKGMFNHKLMIVPGKLATAFSCFLRILPNRLLAAIYYIFRKKNTNDIE